MSDKKEKRIKKFEEFINIQNNSMDEDEYEYSDSSTIKNRFSNLFSGSKSRLKNTFKTFLKTKKGTCWELAISYDYYLLEKGIKNHHIVAVKTGSVTCHTFNMYIDNNNKLHIIDLFQKFKDTAINSIGEFEAILSRMYDKRYENWYVISEVKDNFSERFKRLGSKKLSKFCTEKKKDGGFMIINKSDSTFQPNDKKSIAWKFRPFKFPAFG